MGLSPDIFVLSVIYIVIYRAVGNGLHGSALEEAVEQAVYKLVLEAHIVDAVGIPSINSLVFTLAEAKFVR